MTMPSVDLINRLSEIVRQLQETSVLEHERNDLNRQIAELRKEIDSLHAKHATLVQEIRHAQQAVEAVRASHVEAKAELKKLLQPVAA
jgi:uncharacterized protein YlxW (UPF0749 family)